MSPFQNMVNMVGWIRKILPSAQDEFRFLLLQPHYHEHFRSANSDTNQLLSIEVFVPGSGLTDSCKNHLEVGHRVQVFGRLVPALTGGLALEAWGVERAETLESFRFVNHLWNYELRAKCSAGMKEVLQ